MKTIYNVALALGAARRRPVRWKAALCHRATHADRRSQYVVTKPRTLALSVATTGPLPVELFILGYTLEQALVVHVQGKGLVLIIGCGHPGVEALVTRAEQVFQRPIYGVIGGLHLPVTDDRARLGPLMPQQLLGAPNPPWRPIGHADLQRAVTYLQGKRIELVAVSAHDSCDASLRAFATA